MTAGRAPAPEDVVPGARTAGGPFPYRSDLQGLRGVLIVIVMAFHAWQWTHPAATPDARSGSVAAVAAALDWPVVWFFVVTAFLNTRPVFVDSLLGRPVLGAGRFLLRTLIRIVPPYWTAILVIWATRNSAAPGNWLDLVEHLLFVQAFDSRRVFFTDGPAWAVTTDVAFVLVAAAVVLPFCRHLGARAGRDPGALPRPRAARHHGVLLFLPGAVLILAGLTFGVLAVHVHEAAGRWAVWFNPLAQAPALGVGLLLAAWSARLARSGRSEIGARVAATLRGAGLPVLVFSAVIPNLLGGAGHAGGNLAQRLTATVGFALLVAGTVLAPPRGRWSRAMSTPVLTYLGAISYSLCLWHEPVLILLGRHGLLPQQPDDLLRALVVVIVGGVAAGAIAHRVVERPALQLMHLLTAQVQDRYELLAPDPPTWPARRGVTAAASR